MWTFYSSFCSSGTPTFLQTTSAGLIFPGNTMELNSKLMKFSGLFSFLQFQVFWLSAGLYSNKK